MKHLFKNLFLAGTILFGGLSFISAGILVNNPAPPFTLNDINGKPHNLSDYKGKFVVLEWVNYKCPFVKKHYDTGNMQALQKEYTSKGVIWLSICSSAKGKEGNLAPSEWKKESAKKKAAGTAILIDEDGKVGRAFGAKSTPHMFVIDPQQTIVYQGAIDDKRTTDVEDVKTAKNYVKQALDEAMAGKTVTVPQTESYGCSVKY